MPDKNRVETFIDGMDELLNGGVPEAHTVLIAGPAGSGKTTFGMEFLYRGIEENDDNALFVSFEEPEEQLVSNLPFEWDFEEKIEEGSLNIVKYDPYQHDEIIDLIRSSIKENDAKRVVIDSLTALNLYVDSVKDVRKLILDMNAELRDLECTAFYVGEIKSSAPNEISRYGVEEFIADGVVTLRLAEMGAELSNQILVRKMRGTDHDKKVHPFKFGDEGLKVYAKEKAFQGEEGDIF
ncbi:MAG: ATPase domain-containing protein [Candidatus Nanohaloarchaea archaeon]|nr:ATPase domain-containing protein [Candidatus Nanohaloarchaea archaeon]